MTTQLIRFAPLSFQDAEALSSHLEERMDWELATITSFEIEEDRWVVEVYSTTTVTAEQLHAEVSKAVEGYDAPAFACDNLDETDWVKKSLEGLPPVQAGNIFVYGSHDRHRIPAGSISIEIEAALAFGTGHHGTTLGCLLAFNEIIKTCKPERILDVGTGTGVLAIAAALTLKIPVLATDIDPVSVQTAEVNAQQNGAAPWFRVIEATGMDHDEIRENAPYDVIFANILAAPLVDLAPAITGETAPEGYIILSGLLEKQIEEVSQAYTSRGCTLLHTGVIEGWAALTLQKID